MKKIAFLLFSLVLLTWCWADNNVTLEKIDEKSELTYQKQKDCIDYRNNYINYLNKKLSLKDWDYIDELQVFYSEYSGLCISVYELILNSSDWTEIHEYNIDDVYKDEHLYWDSDFLFPNNSNNYEDWIKELREHKKHYDDWNNIIHKYKTWKSYHEEREEIEKEL